MVIYFMGDSSLSVPTSHGNSVMTEIQDTKRNWHQQYKEIISENREGSEYVSKPRNMRDVPEVCGLNSLLFFHSPVVLFGILGSYLFLYI